MRKPILTIAVLVLLSLVFSQEDKLSLEDMVGIWHGNGRFLNRSTHIEYGLIEFSLIIHPDYSITGKMAGIQFSEAELKIDNWNHGYSAKTRLRQKLDPDKSIEKLCLVFLLEPPKNNHSTGNFHLKSNFWFDFTMEVGSIDLQRTP